MVGEAQIETPLQRVGNHDQNIVTPLPNRNRVTTTRPQHNGVIMNLPWHYGSVTIAGPANTAWDKSYNPGSVVMAILNVRHHRRRW